MDKSNRMRSRREQRGGALLVGMILLVVSTMIAVVAMGSTVLQERMTGAQRNDSLAHQGAESALRGAERNMWDQYAASDGLNVSARAAGSLDEEVLEFRENAGWLEPLIASEYGDIDLDSLPNHSGSGRLAEQPRLVVERLPGSGCLEAHCGGATTGGGSVGMVDYFRITARSTGADARVIRSSESTYAMGR
ncbi:MAG: hypothetical protein HYV17_13875 [Xanthomonadales bacterium]|nr:hypothetical protein [Xanthomonadales bacterium]